MAAEAEAAREARAKVIAAEGEKKASRALREASEVISESPSALQVNLHAYSSLGRTQGPLWRKIDKFVRRNSTSQSKLFLGTAFNSHCKWNNGPHGSDVDRYKAEIILINFALGNNF